MVENCPSLLRMDTKAPYQANVLITDQAIIYDAKHFGIRYFPLIAVEKIENGIMIVKCGKQYKFKLIYMKRTPGKMKLFQCPGSQICL